jgi:signal transduction histidine kinase
MHHERRIGLVGLIAWALVGIPAILYHAGTGAPGGGFLARPEIWWASGFLLFGILFALDLRRPRLALLGAESLLAVALALSACRGYEGTPLVLVALQLGLRYERGPGLLWISGQTLLMAVATAVLAGPRTTYFLIPPFLGFQVVTFFAAHLMAREVAARGALAQANAELQALQEVLADSSRLAERLRIAHELHDALGHRLTALTLNLEAALQRTTGATKANLEVAQSLARELLSDVRAIVAGSRPCDGVKLAHALETLVSAVPRPAIHLQVSDDLRIADPDRAQILLRCTQEIVTNAARHSAAENLWIVIEREGETFRIVAHDDGRGSTGARDGFGLRGMRERLERAGGKLDIASWPGRGFDVTALLPIERGSL